jgi:hypothetical protein
MCWRALHFRWLLRVAQRDAGTRVYEAIDRPPQDDSPDAARAPVSWWI